MFPVKDMLFLAPMAGYSNADFRMICREFGCDVTVSEMVNCVRLLKGHKGTDGLLHREDGDRPFGIQLYGSDPDAFRRAAELILWKGAAEFIDVNCGCPVRKVMRRGEGAALMKAPGLIGRIVAEVKKTAPPVLSVKIRLGQSRDERNFLEVCRLAEENGADMIIVHGRELDRLFSGPPDLDALSEIKRSVRIPVVANGGVVDFDSYRQLKSTGCDAVMIGRAALFKPWIFSEIKAGREGKRFEFSLSDRLSLFRRHANTLVSKLGGRQGLKTFRAFSMGYMKEFMTASGRAVDSSFLRRFHNVGDLSAFEEFTRTLAEYCLSGKKPAAGRGTEP